MRRIINISALLLTSMVIWSCTKIETTGGTAAISFSTASLATKADPLDMPAGNFTVTGKYCSGSSWSSGSASDVFDGTLQIVTTDGSGACTYSPARYWKSNNIYRFRAVSPTAPAQLSYTDALDGNALISDFTVNASAAAQKDLMLSDIAEVAIGSPIGTPAPVGLLFHHLLCKVKVQIIEDTSKPAGTPGSDVFTVTGVKLTGMPDKGTYTGTSTSGTWSTISSSALSCINNTVHEAPGSFNDASADIWPDGLKLIPQTITNEVSLVLDYKVAHGSDAPSTKSVVIPIPPITWEAGKVYTYQLKLDEDMFIYFGNITVDTWGSTQSSGSVIIK